MAKIVTVSGLGELGCPYEIETKKERETLFKADFLELDVKKSSKGISRKQKRGDHLATS